MLLKTLSFGIILSVFSASALAGSGHDHGHSHAKAQVKQATAQKNAQKIVASLVERKKLNKSWASAPVKSAEKKVFDDRKEWVIVFVNDKVTDSKKKKLFVFLSLAGEYIAANHTGN